MTLPDIYTITLLSNTFKNFNPTMNSFYDTIIIGIITFIYFFCDLNKMRKKFNIYVNCFLEGDYNKYKVIAKKGNIPISFKAIVWYISNNKNSTIKYIEQFTEFDWNKNDIKVEKDKLFLINQTSKFQITDDISGIMEKENIEKCRSGRDIVEYHDHYILVLYSKTKTLNDIINWIDDIIKQYKKHMKLKSLESQQLLSISYNDKLNIEPVNFESTVTFKNSYLPNNDNIMKKIDFFLNNKEWYDRKGIPYNLGIILYGEPGCGKTRFIKQLMNYTGRHGIDIKLNNKFCFNTLKNIIHNENITDEYIIPQEKRIIIFEDIDSMCNILKDRDLIKNEIEEKKKLEINKNNTSSTSTNTDNNKLSFDVNNKLNNNNLSFFLNIIDGLNECSGRIIVMTTNKIDYLDKAIIRPGRIDIKINFSRYDKRDVCGIINKFWGKDYDIGDIKESVSMKYTSAEIINIFRTTECFDDIKNIFLN